MKVIIYNHTHWDREWYQPFQEFRLRLIEVFDKVLQDLKNDNLNQFFFDGQTIAIEDYLEFFPEKKAEIKKLIEQNKLKIGPWYVLADEFLTTGESLIRNLLIGINQAKGLGEDDFIGYLPDTFGHIASMPMILNSFGIKNSIIWRGAGAEKSEFIWESLDGSFVLTTHLIEGYFQDIFSQKISCEEKAQSLKILLDKIKEYSCTDVLLLPIGADHLATPKFIKQQISEITPYLNDYELKLGSIEEYLKLVKNKKILLSTVKKELRDNSRNFILPGVFSTRLYLKQANAKAFWKLSKIAEPLQSLAEFSELSVSRHRQLDYAWKLLLKNTPHDSICGCSADSVHQEMMSRYTQVDQISDGIIARCLRDISQNISKDNFVFYNASDYDFSGVIKIESEKELPLSSSLVKIGEVEKFPPEILYDIHNIPIQEDYRKYNEYLLWVNKLKSRSINVKEFSNTEVKDIVECTNNSLKNSNVEVKINENGLLSIKNLKTGKEFNCLHKFENRADTGDTYNFNPIINDKPLKARIVNIKKIQDNLLEGILELNYKIDIPLSVETDKKRSVFLFTHNISTRISLKAGSERIEFNTEWVNHSKDHILQLKFNMPEKITETFSEDNFGIIKRTFDPDYSLRSAMPANEGKELKTNTACMQRFVWAQGFGLLTKGLTEYGIKGNELYLTLLRSVGVISKGKIGTRGLAAGPQIKTPEAQCLGLQKAEYAICLSDEPQKLFKEADFFMGSILSKQGESDNENILKENNLISFNNENIYCYAIKKPFDESNALIVRVFNISNNDQSCNINSDIKISEIQEVNSLEEKINKTNWVNKKVTLKANEFKTFKLY